MRHWNFVWNSIGSSFKIGRPRSRGGEILDEDGQFGWKVLKIRQFSWTFYVYHSLIYSVIKKIKQAVKILFLQIPELDCS